MTELKSPNDLLGHPIHWKKVAPGHWEARIAEKTLTMKMNDFPDEPLYTVTFAGQSMYLDDAPPGWSIE